ncbi:MAG: hypothetical protein ACJ71Y_21780 [Blastococcus sp.]
MAALRCAVSAIARITARTVTLAAWTEPPSPPASSTTCTPRRGVPAGVDQVPPGLHPHGDEHRADGRDALHLAWSAENRSPALRAVLEVAEEVLPPSAG